MSLKYHDLLLTSPPTAAEIKTAVRNPAWQKFRASLHGISTPAKLRALRSYKKAHPGRITDIVVHNYINALKRGGLL